MSELMKTFMSVTYRFVRAMRRLESTHQRQRPVLAVPKDARAGAGSRGSAPEQLIIPGRPRDVIPSVAAETRPSLPPSSANRR